MENKDYSREGGCGMCEGCEGCQTYGGRHDSCNTGCRQMYGMRCGGRHYLLRWILGILILAFVFGAGIKLGEFRERMQENGYGGYGMMKRSYNDTVPGYGMMQWRNGADAEAQYRYGMMGGAEQQKQAVPVR